ncbi:MULTISPECIES: glycosyltransferase [Chromohalobacter]|uniref:Glycosyltransferase n=1 Tax=Chromohalobacter moromii TaxID=2860329 RepID=A0A9X2X5E0_9GAMM|nr:glycosyltransferase [Chromohalobacter moromii]MCT8498591.1 glycosyltransferase [Chromohalobacter canadensis]MCT8506813.1 glycosyltransferase [Chromohalobacter moromii]
MKICIVTPSFSGGGAERIAVNLANYYAKNGLDVCLVVFEGVGPYRRQVGGSIKLIDLNVKRLRYDAWLKLRKVIKDESPEYVLSVMRGANIFVGLALPIMNNIKVAFREANTMEAFRRISWRRRLIHKFLMKFSYGRADVVIANSIDTKKDLVNNNIVQESHVKVIGNPVINDDLNEKAGGALCHDWLSSSDVLVVLHVGRLDVQKNQALLLSAFSLAVNSVPNLKLVILGEGEEKKNLEELASELGVKDSVDFVAFQDNPYPYYKAADLFVLSSDWEGFGNVIVEALACGTPVISTDCPGGPRTILANGKYGVLVPCGDAERLSSEIVSHVSNVDKWNFEELKMRANEFTVETVAKKYLEAIR